MILDRYIGRSVAASTAGVMAVLLTVYYFSSLAGELSDIGTADYHFPQAIQYTLLLAPRQAYELFPLVALMGAMLGLGALASHSELTVMRAAGLSVRRITWAVLKTGLFLVLLVTLLGEVISPPLEKYARIERARALHENFVNTASGLWAREGQSFLNIQRLFPGGLAAGVSIYRLGADEQVELLVFAERGEWRDGGWHLINVTESALSMAGVTTRFLPERSWETALTPQVMDTVAVPAENLSIVDLWGYVGFLEQNGLDAGRYSLALWTRVVTPLATAGMLLLAVPFIFGSQRSVSIGQRVVIGGLIGIGFYLFNAIFSRFGVLYAIPPLLAAALPTVVVFALWLGLMRRLR